MIFGQFGYRRSDNAVVKPPKPQTTKTTISELESELSIITTSGGQI
tara:strand:- start:284 stop:421 length:138 start_codon:yes stop_codon:yes gene_type:complete